MRKTILFLFAISFLTSCTSLLNSPKYALNDGKYVMKINGEKKEVFIDNEDDNMKLKSEDRIYDFPVESKSSPEISPAIRKSTLDVDVLSVLAKFRPAVSDVPAQINANINANLYIGIRKDIYKVSYQKNHFDIYNRRITHFGFSTGIFLGFGNTYISPTTTQNTFNGEYDGIVFQKGIAGIVAIEKFTVGIGVGFDNLLSSQKNVWIYQNKPWLGVMLGLNLN